MSKNVAIFVDVANMYYAARGQDVDVDYVALLKHATKGRDLIRAYAYSGLDPQNENQRKFLDFLAKNGYKVVQQGHPQVRRRAVKANLDIELVVDLFRLADRMDIAVIVSGDGDFASAIRALQDKGVRCEVISFRPNTSSDLIAVADEFMDIMKVASIERGKGMKVPGMAAPEMPAKEVNPEFGFREASRSVAAAAISAIRGGGASETTGTGRGRGRTTRPAPVAASATAPAPSPDGQPAEAAADLPGALDRSDTDELGRRRRRRRGGRGRGRRREEGALGAARSRSVVSTGRSLALAARPPGWPLAGARCSTTWLAARPRSLSTTWLAARWRSLLDHLVGRSLALAARPPGWPLAGARCSTTWLAARWRSLLDHLVGRSPALAARPPGWPLARARRSTTWLAARWRSPLDHLVGRSLALAARPPTDLRRQQCPGQTSR